MIDQATLKSLLEYNPTTGEFTWKVKSGRSGVGKNAGAIKNKSRTNNYCRVIIGINGTSYKAHRLAWLYVYGVLPPTGIDHINGNSLDNRIANLRLATNQQNQMNKERKANNTSGMKGVIWDRRAQKWRAQIKKSGKCIYIGCFDRFEDASNARIAATIIHHGEFGRI